MSQHMPDCDSVWKEYVKGLGCNAALGLDDTVRTNEDFFYRESMEGRGVGRASDTGV